MWVCTPSVLLFTYNLFSKQLILLVLKKPDADFVPLRAMHHFMLADMIHVSVKFPMFEASAMYSQMDSNF